MDDFCYGDPSADKILIQMVDDYDLEVIESEIDAISQDTDESFRLITIKVNSWNRDLSPWKAPAVFGNEDFGEGAADTLDEILTHCYDKSKAYYIGGYSLAGLFALWASYQTDIFEGVAAASPSMWFPGFVDYMKEHDIKSRAVYLSLGDKEEKTRNPVMAQVGVRIREAHDVLEKQEVKCVLEWNKGNHFRDADIRTAKAFSWILHNVK